MASPLSKLFANAAVAVDHRFGWDKLPKPLGIVTLIGLRTKLREKNLYDTGRGYPAATLKALEARGHSVMVRVPGTSANSVLVTPAGLVGAADTRSRGALAAGN